MFRSIIRLDTVKQQIKLSKIPLFHNLSQQIRFLPKNGQKRGCFLGKFYYLCNEFGCTKKPQTGKKL